MKIASSASSTHIVFRAMSVGSSQVHRRMVYIGLCLWMGGLRRCDHGRLAGLDSMEDVKTVCCFFQED